ncbi:hypothetical protein [Rhodococcus sp. BS-15]|uniref:hypothetical protein n=1 Tax=Rhodococcus sp. BS-15 TaxID=1304954 RepID=UPI000FFC6964|nr:hypothetical protein [Rhodococcus sp. BS-15]
MLITAGLVIILAAAVASLTFRTRGKTTPANWALVVMIAGSIVTIAGLWIQLDDPNNAVHWILKVGSTASVAIIAAAGLGTVRRTRRTALLDTQRNNSDGVAPGEPS